MSKLRPPAESRHEGALSREPGKGTQSEAGH